MAWRALQCTVSLSPKRGRVVYEIVCVCVCVCGCESACKGYASMRKREGRACKRERVGLGGGTCA